MNLPAHKKMLSAAAAASVMLLTAACGSGSDDTTATTSTSAPAGADSADSANGSYKDGDYDAEASYANPAGSSEVKVELTLADNKVTAVKVTPEATNGTSRGFQSQFAGGVSGEVVGKSLDEIKVSKVAGSSLTAGGFNKAIEQIKADARA